MLKNHHNTAVGGVFQRLHKCDGDLPPTLHPGPSGLRIYHHQGKPRLRGTPWLSHDAHFQRIAAATKLPSWPQVEASLWTLYFTSAKLSFQGLEGLAVVPTQQEEESQKKRATTSRGAGSTQRGNYSPYTPPFPICKNWNFKNCTESSCRFRHICMECRSPNHKGKDCSSRGPASAQEDHYANNAGEALSA